LTIQLGASVLTALYHRPDIVFDHVSRTVVVDVTPKKVICRKNAVTHADYQIAVIDSTIAYGDVPVHYIKSAMVKFYRIIGATLDCIRLNVRPTSSDSRTDARASRPVALFQTITIDSTLASAYAN
jgi:hypothetical protein